MSGGGPSWAGPEDHAERGLGPDVTQGGGSVCPAERAGGAISNPQADSPRMCTRLEGRSKGGALEKAMLRKANCREGATPVGFPSRRGTARRDDERRETSSNGRRLPGHKKIQRKGAKCGILLSYEEVRCFRDCIGTSS